MIASIRCELTIVHFALTPGYAEKLEDMASKAKNLALIEVARGFKSARNLIDISVQIIAIASLAIMALQIANLASGRLQLAFTAIQWVGIGVGLLSMKRLYDAISLFHLEIPDIRDRYERIIK